MLLFGDAFLGEINQTLSQHSGRMEFFTGVFTILEAFFGGEFFGDTLIET